MSITVLLVFLLLALSRYLFRRILEGVLFRGFLYSERIVSSLLIFKENAKVFFIFNFCIHLEKSKLWTSRKTLRWNHFSVLRIFIYECDKTKEGLFFYHNKIHPPTNYKVITNKSNKTRQHRTQNLDKRYTA